MPISTTKLLETLSTGDAAARKAALDALSDVPDAHPDVLDALIVAVDDEDGEVRLAAVHALGAMDPVDAEMALYWASQSHDVRVQIAANTLLEGTARARGPESTVWRDPAIGRSE